MNFNHAYYHSMDRGYYVPEGEGGDEDLSKNPQKFQAKSNLGPSDIGFSSNPFQRPIEAVNARLKQGVGYIDIPFFGAGKGNKERYTPESISKKERRDLRELAEINEAKLSTHASTNIQGLAGMTQQGGFDEQSREKSLKEIKKAVDFASDVQGGAVVFHTGEWPRPFSEQEWNEDKMFVNYPEEENIAVQHMVDERTGEVIGSVRRSVVVHEPKYEKDEQGRYLKLDGTPVEDENDVEEMLRRQPVWDQKTEQFKTKKMQWEDFKERAKENGTKPEEEYMKAKMQEQLLRSRGQSLFYSSQGYEESLEAREAIENALEFYQQLEDDLPEDQKKELTMKQLRGGRRAAQVQQLVEKEDKPITDVLKEQLVQTERSLKHIHEASAAADVQAKDIQERLKHMKPVREYGLEKSADTVARAAQYAYEKTKKKNPKRPIYVSPESYLPETYGSHPDEISKLIDKSREHFKERMKQRGVNEKKAEELAKDHIKGTLDTGHFNLWRQHFEGSDKEFNKWYLKQVRSLVESGKIGQVHITDNMGFDDEHLTPGQGKVPMDEVMDIIEDADMEDIVVESGSFNPVDIVPDTFSYMGSPVYGAARTGGPSFGQMHQQHFGYNAPPFYVVGGYAPSNEWKLWSEVQLE